MFKVEAIPNMGMSIGERATIFPFFTVDGVLAHYSFVSNGIYNTPLGMLKEDVFTNLVGKENLHLVLIKEASEEEMKKSVITYFNQKFKGRYLKPHTEAVLFLLETTNNALDCVFYDAFKIKDATPVYIEDTPLVVSAPFEVINLKD